MISVETVEDVLQKMSNMSDAQAEELTTQMSEEQPMVFAYLLAMSENEAFNQNETETFLYIGMVAWQIARAGVKDLKKVTEKELDGIEKANEDLLEKMASDSAGDFVSAAESMVENYPEPELLRYVTTALMEDEDGNTDNPPFREDGLGVAFLHLKIVMDAFVGLPK